MCLLDKHMFHVLQPFLKGQQVVFAIHKRVIFRKLKWNNMGRLVDGDFSVCFLVQCLRKHWEREKLYVRLGCQFEYWCKDSCRTVALWFHNLVSDHNATVPVMQKVAIYVAYFLCTLGMYFSSFQLSLIAYLLLSHSRHITLPICIYPPLFVFINQSTRLFQILCN
jgi:hypothetical protein